MATGLLSFPVVEVIDDPGPSFCQYSSSDFLEQVNYYKKMLQCQDSMGLVAVDIPRSTRMVAAVFALADSRIPFAFLPPDTPPSVFHATHVLTDSGLEALEKSGHPVTPTTSREICYCIRTSGSTGTPKCVTVPGDAIWPNVVDFQDRFKISTGDRVLFSTSTLFDPSVIEIFLCMLTGAEMVIVSDKVRSSPTRLAEAIRRFRPTFLQLTPAVFRLLDFDGKEDFMRSVRILLLGGEKLPLEFVQQRRRRHFPNARVFDVYGITEVSCWATVFEVDESCTEVVLGEEILNTRLKIDENGRLSIGGSRRCSIDGVWSGEWTPTGDLVETTEDGRLRIVGRIDDLVKINGIRCHLVSMAQKLCKAAPEVEFSRFLLWKEAFLVLFIKSPVQIEYDVIAAACPNLLRPSGVIYLDDVPVNRNGKIDTPCLLNMLEMSCKTREEEFWRILARFHMSRGQMDVSFVECGVKSLEAAEIALVLGDANAMQEILASGTTVADIVKKYLQPGSLLERGDASENGVDMCTATISERRQPEVLWALDTKKCVDGAPLLFREDSEEFVVVASHSGVVACFSHSSSQLRWKIRIEGARFEASPSQSGDSAVVGAYNGILYFIALRTGEIRNAVDLGDSVKAQAAVDSNGAVYVIAYNRKLFRITADGSVSWSVEVSAGSPGVACLSEGMGLVVVTTIKGSVEAFSMTTGEERWKLHTAAPIFSPAVLDEDGILVTAVDGTVLLIDAQNGKKKCFTKLDESLFAPAARIHDRMMIASQKGTVFVLAPDSLRTLRRVSFPECSFVRAPFLIGQHLVLVSTDGRLLVSEGILCGKVSGSSFRLGRREVFGQPVVTEDHCLIVGCRDDWLRCYGIDDITGYL